MEPQRLPALNKGTPFFNAWRLGFLGVLILAVVAYLPSLRGLAIWDDDALLHGNGIGGSTALGAMTSPFLGAYFRPLVSLSFFIENRLWSGIPFYYHQTNILLHVLTCAALIGLVWTAFQKRALALMSGLLFAVQPAQVGAVAWIGGRTDALCCLLTVLFAYTLILGLQSLGKKRILWLSVAVLMFFLAALTKEQILALILLVPFAAKVFTPNSDEFKKPDFKSYVRLIVPYVIASVVFVVLWFAFNPTPFKALGRGLVGQIMTAGRSTVYYTLLFLAPSGKWMHTLSLGSIEQAGPVLAWAGFALFLALLAGVVYCMRRNPKLGWFAGFVALAILPVSNIVPLPSLLVAPYRAGVAGAGVAVLLAWLLTNFPFGKAGYGLGIAFLGWCSWLTFWGCEQWHDPVKIFTRIAAEDPYSIVTRRNLSSYLMQVGNAQGAADQMKQALTILYGDDAWQQPQSAYQRFLNDKVLDRKVIENQGNEVTPEAWLGELFAQLGFAEGKLQHFGPSRSAFETAELISPKNPQAHIGLAEFAIADGKYDEAVHHLRIATAIRGSDPTLLAILGHVYLQENKLELAAETYKKAISLRPWFGLTYQDLAEVQVKEGNIPSALKTLKTALNCQVNDASSIQARIDQLESTQKGGGTVVTR